jgi:hypothetical protein
LPQKWFYKHLFYPKTKEKAVQTIKFCIFFFKRVQFFMTAPKIPSSHHSLYDEVSFWMFWDVFLSRSMFFSNGLPCSCMFFWNANWYRWYALQELLIDRCKIRCGNLQSSDAEVITVQSYWVPSNTATVIRLFLCLKIAWHMTCICLNLEQFFFIQTFTHFTGCCIMWNCYCKKNLSLFSAGRSLS